MTSISPSSYFTSAIFLPEFSSPEERLWVSIVIQTIADVEIIILKAKKVSRALGVAPVIFRVKVEEIEREIESKWFMHVCMLASFHPDYVYREISRMRRHHGFDEIKFVLSGRYLRLALFEIKRTPQEKLLTRAKTLLSPVGKWVYFKRKYKLKMKPHVSRTRKLGRPKKAKQDHLDV